VRPYQPYQGIKEANVYGVLVPKQDGRAGMASIVTSDDFNIDGFYEYLNEQLPKYSIPVFIRISPEIEKTGTFKYKKTDLAKEGFDPQVVNEPLYFASGEENKYINLDTNLFVKNKQSRSKNLKVLGNLNCYLGVFFELDV
jgi:fatty-acyl-CoA synthase